MEPSWLTKKEEVLILATHKGEILNDYPKVNISYLLEILGWQYKSTNLEHVKESSSQSRSNNQS